MIKMISKGARLGCPMVARIMMMQGILITLAGCSYHEPDVNTQLLKENQRLIRENERLQSEIKLLSEREPRTSNAAIDDTALTSQPDQLLPPIIVNKYYWHRESDRNHEAVVFLRVKADLDYPDMVPIFFRDPDEVPIIGKVVGSATKVSIAGRIVSVDEKGDIFCRMHVSLGRGYNRIPVRVESRSGRIAKGYMEVKVGTM